MARIRPAGLRYRRRPKSPTMNIWPCRTRDGRRRSPGDGQMPLRRASGRDRATIGASTRPLPRRLGRQGRVPAGRSGSPREPASWPQALVSCIWPEGARHGRKAPATAGRRPPRPEGARHGRKAPATAGGARHGRARHPPATVPEHACNAGPRGRHSHPHRRAGHPASWPGPADAALLHPDALGVLPDGRRLGW